MRRIHYYLVGTCLSMAAGCNETTPPPTDPGAASTPTAAATSGPAAGPTAAPTARPAAESIGSATMEADGTLVLTLRAEGPGGIVGDSQVRYPPSHAEYRRVLDHLGGLEPGQSKPVPPWPDRSP